MGRHSGEPAPRRSAKPFAVAGLLGSGLAIAVGGIGLSGVLHHGSTSAAAQSPAAIPVPPPSATIDTTAETTASQIPVAAPVAAVHPVTLQIPAIAVNTSMELLGVAADGTLQTPANPKQAGWFTGSALPGEPGPVVIAGHVDSVTGPAVFAHLKNVKVGAPITITLSDGRRVVYRATSVLVYAKDKFPTQSVYGPRPDSELRLITCGGAFVKGQYVDNVVVFAKLSA